MANEFAVVLRLPSIVFNIIPVILGRIAPPKKSKNHNKVATVLKSVKKGIGIEQNRVNIEINYVILNACFDLNPPRLDVTLPPTISPKIGAVMLIIPKEVKTTVSGTCNSVIQ